MPPRDKNDTLSPLQLDRRQILALGSALAFTGTACGSMKSSQSSAQSLLASGRNRNLFEGIDTVVALVMENRSFDHYFGAINQDPLYPAAGSVDGFSGDEFNVDRNGVRVSPYRLSSGVQADPPHSWKACHAQWNGGRNDGFASVYPGPRSHEVMGYFDRETLPFSYWLADNYTLCDRWFGGVLGPTWPNRSIIHATDARGLKNNVPYIGRAPKTIWEALPNVGKIGRNYHAGRVATYTGMYLGKVLSGVNPTAPIGDFFRDAEKGTLPAFSLIDPDFQVNDDHPSHDVRMGQALIASIYQALAKSPQWSRSLFIITYDEHGGFFDHVSPPTCADADPEFRQLGFRVPSLVIGPTVRRGAVCKQTLEHSSIAATLKTCFGMASLSPRMSAANDLSSCIDPSRVGLPQAAAGDAPVLELKRSKLSSLLSNGGIEGQPELARMVSEGSIPSHAIDSRSSRERTQAWLTKAESLGAISILEDQ
ncbi:MAG: phosphoesterase [Oligoflexus sp.]|nr:phosphoesterase [Oligoflexus sp.]